MKIKVEKCGERKIDENTHWEAGALYQYTTGPYYHCVYFEGNKYLVSFITGITHRTEGLSKASNRKLSKGECITLTVE